MTITPSQAGRPGRAAPLPPSDALVIERSHHDPESFAALFERHAAEIHRYVARRVGGPVADDLLGETFARAFQHRRRFDLAEPDARPWLYGIATNLVRGHRRSEARRLRALSRQPRPAGEEAATDLVDARLTAGSSRTALAQALAALPARQRDVVLLHAWAELDYAQIALALGIPVGTVRSRLHRARVALRGALPRDLTDAEGDANAWTR